MNVFTDTLDQFNVSLLNKINFFLKNTCKHMTLFNAVKLSSRQQYALAQQKVLNSAPPPPQQQLNLLLHQALKIR